MKSICRTIKEQISSIFSMVRKFIVDYINGASDKCKIITVFAIFLLIFFVVLNIWEWILNNEVKNCIRDFVDKKIYDVSKIGDTMTEPIQNLGIILKDKIFKLLEQFVVIASMAASAIIGFYIGLVKKTGEVLLKILSKEVGNNTDRERMYYIPVVILSLIDALLIVCSILQYIL